MSRLFLFSSIALVMALSQGCTSTNTRGGQDIYTSSHRGFTQEMDEPSSRGLLARLTPEQYDCRYRFCVAPDGENIVFSAATSDSPSSKYDIYNLWKMPLKGGAPIKLTSGGDKDCLYPSYTPDGKFIVYSSGGQLWRIRENGAGGRMKIPGSGAGNDFAPQVSVDGKIVFCSAQSFSYGRISGNRVNRQSAFTGSSTLIWVCDANGGNLTQMREGEQPVWSPDGKLIIFTYNGDLWKMNADGTELTQLTSTSEYLEGAAAVASDGQTIVYASNESNKDGAAFADFNIWTMRMDGTERTQLTELEAWDSWPMSVDDVLYFMSARAAKDRNSRKQRIWRIRQGGGVDMQKGVQDE